MIGKKGWSSRSTAQRFVWTSLNDIVTEGDYYWWDGHSVASLGYTNWGPAFPLDTGVPGGRDCGGLYITPNFNTAKWANLGCARIQSNIKGYIGQFWTHSPTASPTLSPTAPSLAPSDAPSQSPSRVPSRTPTSVPTSPSDAPSHAPYLAPTIVPSNAPSSSPTAPSDSPTLSPSAAPTSVPTDPTDAPSSSPTAGTNPPSQLPTNVPSASPSQVPSASPTDPTDSPTLAPTGTPTNAPTNPTDAPSESPSSVPSASPTVPSFAPSLVPSNVPSTAPTSQTVAPSQTPSNAPSSAPTAPTNAPSVSPSQSPSAAPTVPTDAPSITPSESPTQVPSNAPSRAPSQAPTNAPSSAPTDPTDAPSNAPSDVPSASPTHPTNAPSDAPSDAPSQVPSTSPTDVPSNAPSVAPSMVPSMIPSDAPSMVPSDAPSTVPTSMPTSAPTSPTAAPSLGPSATPSRVPSMSPTVAPTEVPSQEPTETPSQAPSMVPTMVPSTSPSSAPTDPTNAPTVAPSESPTVAPTDPSAAPSVAPSVVPSRSPSNAPSQQPSLAPTVVPTELPTVEFDETDVIHLGISISDLSADDVVEFRKELNEAWCNGIEALDSVDFECHHDFRVRISEIPADSALEDDEIDPNEENRRRRVLSSNGMNRRLLADDLRIIVKVYTPFKREIRDAMRDSSSDLADNFKDEATSVTGTTVEKVSIDWIRYRRTVDTSDGFVGSSETQFFGLGVIGLILLLVLCGLIHATMSSKKDDGTMCCSPSDDASLAGIFLFGWQIFDHYSDIIFALSIILYKDQTYFIACALFIAIPWIANILYAIYCVPSIRKETNTFVRSYLSCNRAMHIIVLTVLSGGAYSVIELLNSKLFGCDVTRMGLTRSQLGKFARSRMWTNVLMANLPQLGIQVAWFLNTGKIKISWGLAIISTVVSIVVSVIRLIKNGLDSKHDELYIIEGLIESSQDTSWTKRLGLRNRMSQGLAQLLEIAVGNVYVVTSRVKSKGSDAKFELLVSIVRDKKGGEVSDKLELQRTTKHAWGQIAKKDRLSQMIEKATGIPAVRIAFVYAENDNEDEPDLVTNQFVQIWPLTHGAEDGHGKSFAETMHALGQKSPTVTRGDTEMVPIATLQTGGLQQPKVGETPPPTGLTPVGDPPNEDDLKIDPIATTPVADGPTPTPDGGTSTAGGRSGKRKASKRDREDSSSPPIPEMALERAASPEAIVSGNSKDDAENSYSDTYSL